MDTLQNFYIPLGIYITNFKGVTLSNMDVLSDDFPTCLPWDKGCPSPKEIRGLRGQSFLQWNGLFQILQAAEYVYNITRPGQRITINIATTVNSTTMMWLYIICFSLSSPRALYSLSSRTRHSKARFSDSFWGYMEGNRHASPRRGCGEGRGERGEGRAMFKHILEAKIAEGAVGKAALFMVGEALYQGHMASSTGFIPHSLIYGQEYATALQRHIKEANRTKEARAKSVESTMTRTKSIQPSRWRKRFWYGIPENSCQGENPKHPGPKMGGMGRPA
jgi:hypothetical protein